MNLVHVLPSGSPHSDSIGRSIRRALSLEVRQAELAASQVGKFVRRC
jgi:hypothetical protein